MCLRLTLRYLHLTRDLMAFVKSQPLVEWHATCNRLTMPASDPKQTLNIIKIFIENYKKILRMKIFERKIIKQQVTGTRHDFMEDFLKFKNYLLRFVRVW